MSLHVSDWQARYLQAKYSPQQIALAIAKVMGATESWPEYKSKSVEFCTDVLHVEHLTADQQLILRSLIKPPCKVLVPSGHNTGKTFLAACAILWWYYTRPESVIITLGPKFDSLKDTVWGEVRILAARAGLPNHFIGPEAPHMRSGPEHYAKAVTALKDAALAGRHKANMLFVIEEACAVEEIFWTVLKTMFDPSLGHAILAIFNPTDMDSQAYREDVEIDRTSEPAWTRVRLSSLDHPNLEHERRTGQKLIKGAVSLKMVDEWVRDWAEPVRLDERIATDIEWPRESGNWHRPGPLFQGRVLGTWPETGAGVWSDHLFEACCDGEQPAFPQHTLPEIGCDTALGKGDDYHSICARWGSVCLRLESANVMDPKRIYDRLIRIAGSLAALVNSCLPSHAASVSVSEIPIKLDDDGVGGALGSFLRAEGYNAIQLGAGTKPSDPNQFPLKRDELWFACADRARLAGVYLGALPRDVQQRLRQQLCAPVWELDRRGRRCVEPKDDTKEKIGRSPDDADSLNLCFYEGADYQAPQFVDGPRYVDGPSMADERGLFGRRA